MATNFKMYIAIILQFMGASVTGAFAGTDASTFPHFRHVDLAAVAPQDLTTVPIRLLADQDFAPFSFVQRDGKIAGISVELALSACSEMKLNCEIVAKPYPELMSSLISGEGEALISGMRLTPEILKSVSMTRPYFFSFGRFVTRNGTPFANADIRTMAGRRIGYVKATGHAAFLEKYYNRSALTPFDTEAAMFESLRSGGLDAAFGDALHVSFWLKGSAARGCCQVLDGGFVDRSSFSRGLSFLVKADQPALREAFDFALDRLEDKGVSAKIFANYLPESPF